MSADPHAAGSNAADRIARLERVLISSNDSFWERHLRTGSGWYSQRLRTLFGLGPDEQPDEQEFVQRFVHPDDAAAVIAAHRQAVAALAPFAYEVRCLEPGGGWRWMRGRGRVWVGADGRADILAGVLSDVHDEKEARLELARMTDRLEHAVVAADAGVFERMLDEEDMFVSERLWALLGYTPGELPARRSTFIDMVHPDDRAAYLAEARAAFEALGRLTAVARMRTKSGDYRWFRQDAQPHRLPDGRMRVIGVMADIDEQAQAREALERQRRQLERAVAERTASLEAAFTAAEQRRLEAESANAAKSRFLAHMSHEIRTPLNGVLGLTDLALRVAVEPAQRRLLEVARQSGQTLLRIIDDVLEVSGLEAGTVQPDDQAFDLAGAMADVMRGVMPLVRAKGLAVRYDWSGARTWVRGDAARVRQIATNLLGNAVKFTEHGHVQLVGEIADSGRGRCRARISFEDTGPGLHMQQAARVFDAFEQGDDSLSRRHGGAGLGLSIARGLAEALGGSLDVASAPGQGAVFTVELPFAALDDHRREPPVPPPGQAWLLYATAERGAWMQRRVERLGWSAEVLPGIAAAAGRRRSALAATAPQLVLVDHQALQPDVDLDVLRAALPDAAIRLLVRPDWTDPPLEARAQALGMAMSVVPLAPSDLVAALTAAARAGPQPLPPAPRPPPDAGALHGRVLLVEDNPVNQLIGVKMLESLGIDVQTADDGEAALAACLQRPPALVLMDIQMPVMDGLEATRRLRSMQHDDRLPVFPIVALTAHALDGDREQALAAGIDAYLTKPILVDTLRGALVQWLPVDARSP